MDYSQETCWFFDEYKTWIKAGCPINTKVTSLDISDSKLKSITPNIKNLVNLDEFYCSANQLTVLPSEIGQLDKLDTFDCSDNQLTFIPPEIYKMPNLRNFECSKNKMSCKSFWAGFH